MNGAKKHQNLTLMKHQKKTKGLKMNYSPFTIKFMNYLKKTKSLKMNNCPLSLKLIKYRKKNQGSETNHNHCKNKLNYSKSK